MLVFGPRSVRQCAPADASHVPSRSRVLAEVTIDDSRVVDRRSKRLGHFGEFGIKGATTGTERRCPAVMDDPIACRQSRLYGPALPGANGVMHIHAFAFMLTGRPASAILMQLH